MKILPINTLMFRASQPLKPVREEDKAKMIKELKSRIEADSKKLAELEGENDK